MAQTPPSAWGSGSGNETKADPGMDMDMVAPHAPPDRLANIISINDLSFH